jgi:putative ATPase
LASNKDSDVQGSLLPQGHNPDHAPLAARMRPAVLEEYVGQRHLLGEGKVLDRALASGRLPSLVLWGPPGTGKTTLAGLLAAAIGAEIVTVSAVLAGVKDIRQAVAAAAQRQQMSGRRTVLFVDEIHRFNKAQQDALLPHVERGVVTLIGATTENPSFEVVGALLSRCRVLVLEALGTEELSQILDRALVAPNGLAGTVEIEPRAREHLLAHADGDARAALTTLELASEFTATGVVTLAHVEEAAQRRVLAYDRADAHFDHASALIKSLRGSDPDAALYYMARMLEAGEDPLFILRRLVIFASEDIGNADPNALTVAMAATESFRFVGLPEGALPMTQAVTYLATAPKSNAVIKAYGAARKDVLAKGNLPLPQKILNAPTKLMKGHGYGAGYKYPHNFGGNYVPETYLPEALLGRVYYEPSQNGFEAEISRRLTRWRRQADDEQE